VLVIEDDADIRALLASRLTRLGYPVRTAASGEAGLDAALAELPLAILLDLQLPGIDGWEVARRLRADPATHDVPLIVASVVEPGPEPADVRTSAYLTKPFTARQVETTVIRVAGPPQQPRAGKEPR
jgi:CheY-like chemotaxis protein